MGAEGGRPSRPGIPADPERPEGARGPGIPAHPERPEGARGPGIPLWRRGIGLVVLVAGLGYIVIRLLQAQPVDVEVVYHYGAAKTRLQQAEMRYLHDGEELRRVSFRYDRRRAGAAQRHRIQIPRGEYQVRLDLVYRGKAPEQIRGRRRDLDRERQLLSLSRLLIVSGEGRVDLFIGKGER